MKMQAPGGSEVVHAAGDATEERMMQTLKPMTASWTEAPPVVHTPLQVQGGPVQSAGQGPMPHTIPRRASDGAVPVRTETGIQCAPTSVPPGSVLPPQSETRSIKYWKEDGDVVLRVESTLFRLKGEHLASTCLFLSRPLRDLLDAKTVPAGTKVVDGCPVLGLNLATIGIKAAKFEHFLGLLYHPRRYVLLYTCLLQDVGLISFTDLL